MNPKIETFIISWNEEEFIHLTLKHYLKFGKVNLFDNYSTDQTVAIAKKMGAEISTFGRPGVMDEEEYLKIKNHIWKKSSADYVIVCDVDEILQINESLLKRAFEQGSTIFKTWGWSVYSENIPSKDWSEIQTGVEDFNFCKQILFSPKISDINYSYGCHIANPQGNLRYFDSVVPLFHYRNVGGCDRLIKRHAEYRKRMSEFNLKMNLCNHYFIDDGTKIKEWDSLYQASKQFSPDLIN